MKAFTALLQAMGYREDVTVCPPRMAFFHGNYVDLGNREAWVCDP